MNLLSLKDNSGIPGAPAQTGLIQCANMVQPQLAQQMVGVANEVSKDAAIVALKAEVKDVKQVLVLNKTS